MQSVHSLVTWARKQNSESTKRLSTALNHWWRIIIHMYILRSQLRPFLWSNRHLRLTPLHFPPIAILLLCVCSYGLIFDLLPSVCVCAPLHSRPGSCAGHSPAASFKSSIEFPDDTLQFIKSHPLMDTAVPSLGDEPWFTKTRVR